ncbi:MAG: hypothetical protein BGN89_12200 [Alphaproteobacteria bacterium 64-6]|nr:MAG: hypothetical protein BGN89_12200 [Alphaproteobacteria bacterium 64-6]
MRGKKGVPTCPEMLPVRQAMPAGDPAEIVEHHDFDAPRAGTPPDLGDVCRPLIAAPGTLIVTAGLQDEHARVFAERAIHPRQHLSRGVAGNTRIENADPTSLRLQ